MSLRTNICALGAGLLILTACGEGTWNNPNPTAAADQKVLYSSFALRPKHLDPARAYSSDESTFIDQIYEPPLQYHYLKRPYELEPLTLTEMPKVSYFDADGNQLSEDALQPAYSVYQLNLKKGIMYQPHPAFAQNEDGTPYYNFHTAEESVSFNKLNDFKQTATKELIAQDYIYQIKRLADPKRLAPLRGLLSQYIVGMSEFSKQVKELRKDIKPNDWLDLRQLEMEGVELVDDYTFTIKLKGKYPQFKYWLAFHFFAPVPVEADRFYHLPGLPEKNITLDWMPVGTGAYMMSKNDPNSEIVLSRNPNYHDDFYPTEGEEGDMEKGLLADAGKRLPFVDQIVFRLEKEAIPIWTKFLQGYYDRSGISSDSFDQAVNVSVEGIGLSDEMRAKGIYLNQTVEPATYYTGFNMLDPVVGGYSEEASKLRRAISIAWNEEEYLAIFRNGRGETAMGPVPPGIFGYKNGAIGINPVVFEWKDGKPSRQPIEVAKQLMVEAGYPDGRDAKTGKPLSLSFDTTSGGATKARLDWMRKQFAKLGIQLNFRITDFNRFKDKMQKGNSQVFGYGWLADYPDPENFMFLLHSKQGQVLTGGAGVNSTNYKNEEYDRLFDQMQLMENSPERQQVIDQMLEIIRHDSPWASAWHPHSYVLNNQWVQNAKPHGISKATLKFLNVDTELRKQKQQEWNRPVVWPLVMVFLILAALIVPGYMAFKKRQSRRIGG